MGCVFDYFNLLSFACCCDFKIKVENPLPLIYDSVSLRERRPELTFVDLKIDFGF